MALKVTQEMIDVVGGELEELTADRKRPNAKLADLMIQLENRGPFAGLGKEDTYKLIGATLQQLRRSGRVQLFKGEGSGWRWSARKAARP